MAQQDEFGRPSAARVYDSLLGGCLAFAADREAADRLEAAIPGLRDLARVNREFVLRATAWLGRMKGISQFIDVGCGLAFPPMIHDAAEAAGVTPRVVYVDIDGLAVKSVASVIAGRDGLAAITGDAADPEGILGDPAVRDMIDLGKPVAVIFGAVLGYLDADVAAMSVAGFAGPLAEGSAVVISCAHFGGEAARVLADGPCGEWRNHSAADVESFFGGLRLVRGRVGDVRCWPLLPAEDEGPAVVLGGIGVVD
jgi:S-adenosyl methyltransferase